MQAVSILALFALALLSAVAAIATAPRLTPLDVIAFDHTHGAGWRSSSVEDR